MSTLDAREVYEALALTEEACAHGIDIRCTSRGDATSYLVTYNSIYRLTYDRRTWERILITVRGLVIEIRGRNLRPILEAIRLGTCDVIREYSPDEHILPQPEDPGAPFIESISVEVMGGQTPQGKPKGD